ncbi:LOW QUALITY PROTEIN: hypothetical protein Cgig2_027979 [Carnegiea gigantea]|uniref:ADP/ATP translocase n=1 Tax=Carnegiea gigantea TaxID=171969 RepID=A0A9Q1Q7X5_9CARY|nr:LOW QUALITY PROTEIN: hypothetical protein Cgig2_027979 [Carnegiea gigantea]
MGYGDGLRYLSIFQKINRNPMFTLSFGMMQTPARNSSVQYLHQNRYPAPIGFGFPCSITVLVAVEKSKLNFFVYCLMRRIIAMAARTGTAPIERMKLVLQNEGEILKTANVIKYFYIFRVHFGFYTFFKRLFNGKAREDEEYCWKWFAKNSAYRWLAGAALLSFGYHWDYIRTRLANDTIDRGGQRWQFESMQDTVKSHGIHGIYRGCCGVYRAGSIVYRGLFIGTCLKGANNSIMLWERV